MSFNQTAFKEMSYYKISFIEMPFNGLSFDELSFDEMSPKPLNKTFGQDINRFNFFSSTRSYRPAWSSGS